GSCPAPQGKLEEREGQRQPGGGSGGRQDRVGQRLPLQPASPGRRPRPPRGRSRPSPCEEAARLPAAPAGDIGAPARTRLRAAGPLRLLAARWPRSGRSAPPAARGSLRPAPGDRQCSASSSCWAAPLPRSLPSHLPLPFLPTAVLKPQESLAQLLLTPGSLESEGKTVENYETNVQLCWQEYKVYMDSIQKDWCDWAMISRPYSILQYCLEQTAEGFGLGFPNPWAERIIFETHQIHFANCSLVQPTFSDPPEDVLLAMIIAPICLIPFLVTLVVWRSKDSEAQA
uniref:Receptor activity-modifying protein 2 n=1 Tax=Equus asinus TaxID=9793 RepID=A0A9L0J9L9_EQUAS